MMVNIEDNTQMLGDQCTSTATDQQMTDIQTMMIECNLLNVNISYHYWDLTQ